jgi:hypothetical protein
VYANATKRKEVKTMKYQTPELTASTPAINAVQTTSDSMPKAITNTVDGSNLEGPSAYADWED